MLLLIFQTVVSHGQRGLSGGLVSVNSKLRVNEPLNLQKQKYEYILLNICSDIE